MSSSLLGLVDGEWFVAFGKGFSTSFIIERVIQQRSALSSPSSVISVSRALGAWERGGCSTALCTGSHPSSSLGIAVPISPLPAAFNAATRVLLI